MQPSSARIALVVALATLAGLVPLAMPVNAAPSNAPPLRAGDAFPQFSGQTLAGKPLTLPTAAQDKSAVLVFSFSRKAATDARLWNEHLSHDFPNRVLAYGIILLESAPRLFRGAAVSGIKSVTPVSVQDRTIVLYRDEELWKQRLSVTRDNRAYALLLGADGRIHWTNSGAFSDVEYAHLKSALSRLTPSHP